MTKNAANVPLVCKLPRKLSDKVREVAALAEKGQRQRVDELTSQIVRAAGLNQQTKVRDLQADRKAMRLRGKFINVSNAVAVIMKFGVDKLPKDPGVLFDEVCKGEVVVGRPTRREPEGKDAKAAA